MRQEEYLAIQYQIIALTPIVADMDLDGFVNAIERADVLSIAVNPTLWMQKHEDMDRMNELAQALIPFRRAALKMRGEAQNEERN